MSQLLRARLSVIVLLLAAFCPALIAQEPVEEQTYVITLKADVENSRDVAAELVRLYGATLELDAEETPGALIMRLAPARARVVASDPRVAAVESADAFLQATAAASVEVVNWTSGVSYTYDGSGNVRRVGSDTFTYDHANRLVHANVNGVPRDYTYDGFGNRTGCLQWKGTSQESNCQRDKTVDKDENKNRIDQAVYDASGNITEMDGHKYAYDAMNMMTRDTYGVLAREFVYTPDDERIAVYHVGSKWEWTIRDESGRPLREFTSAGAAGTSTWEWVKDYVWRDALLLASRQPETDGVTTYYYHVDHLGSPRRITNHKDRILGSHDYYAFGQDVAGGTHEPSHTPLKYTGHERDTWGGTFGGTLDYMHARYYEPELGRFLSVDPHLGAVSMPQSWNRYAYVLNNPMRYTDPTGADCVDPLPESPCKDEDEFSAYEPDENEPKVFDPDDPMLLTLEFKAQSERGMMVFIGYINEVVEMADPSPVTTFLREWGDDPMRDTPLVAMSFRMGLSKLTGKNPADADAHHIFPRKFREFFEKLGIKWNDPEMGAWWGAHEHRSRAREYNQAWEQFFQKKRTKKEVLKFGWEMAKKYGLKRLFKIKW